MTEPTLPGLCGKPWRGAACESDANLTAAELIASLPTCPRRANHHGSCGPKAGWVWAKDRDALEDLIAQSDENRTP